MRRKLLDSLRRVFRPEFINRLDAVIVFRALSKDDIRRIVRLELQKVEERLAEHSLHLMATEEAIERLAALGYDPEMGARPLRRVIQQKVEDPIADAIIGGNFSEGDTIVIDVGEGEDEITLRRESQAEEPSAPEAAPA
ncbi:MAG TPA: ATP-dependent Clp protease ATP-binding subunit [Anaerolineales bacterium]|nr:ATP-dependent Clp protease ATP-binding subunit [Anaerolineales bacterium]